VTVKDIITCDGFDFKGVGGHSLSMWLLIPLFFPFFPQVFLVVGEIQATYVELKSTLVEKELCVPYRSRFMSLTM